MNHENAEDNLLPEVIVRKSKLTYASHSIISIAGITLIIYISITERLGFSFLPILFVIIFGAYAVYALRGLSDRSIQIKLDQHSISFKDGTTLKWSEIKHVSIERKNFSEKAQLGTRRQFNFEQHFLNIETTFSGQITGYRTAKSVDITNLEYTPRQILHFIEQYKSKYRS